MYAIVFLTCSIVGIALTTFGLSSASVWVTAVHETTLNAFERELIEQREPYSSTWNTLCKSGDADDVYMELPQCVEARKVMNKDVYREALKLTLVSHWDAVKACMIPGRKLVVGTTRAFIRGIMSLTVIPCIWVLCKWMWRTSASQEYPENILPQSGYTQQMDVMRTKKSTAETLGALVGKEEDTEWMDRKTPVAHPLLTNTHTRFRDLFET